MSSWAVTTRESAAPRVCSRRSHGQATQHGVGVGVVEGELRELWRYPVKSLAGEALGASEVVAHYGIPGDRAWALRDEQAGEIASAKKLPGLLTLAARYREAPIGAGAPPVIIRLPDGAELHSADPGAAARLSRELGRPVTLWPRRPAEDLAHYRRAQPITDMVASISEASELLPEEPTPDLSAIPADLSIVADHVSPPGTYFDYFHVHLLTLQSMASLQALLPAAQIDRRRFRPNLVLHWPHTDHAFPELAWAGRRIAIGDLRLQVVMPAMRCSMITHAQAGLPKDPSIMRVVVRECGMSFGVGAQVLEPGPVRVGDRVRLLDAEPH